ncbi:hypothetical protein [Streptomyces sp. NPDC057002]|uniref:hypothetical protein n=1 Tax=Streptomyces sp. NPDC057002 TaxID=3345992 RepID=UPI003633038D
MRTIPVLHQDPGDDLPMIRANWVIFATDFPPGTAPENVPECTSSATKPVFFNRQETPAATILRPNLLHPGWWRGGMGETASPVLPAIVNKEGVNAA